MSDPDPHTRWQKGQEVIVTLRVPGVVLGDDGSTVTVSVEGESTWRTVPRHAVQTVQARHAPETP